LPPGVRAAVVRVIAPEGNALSLGSGSLIAVSQYHGLVLTNWHVVQGATGQVVVAFPDGFRSGATVLRTDKDWDLAALAVWRPPHVEPIPLAGEAPRPGEPLTIAGYGPGSYRSATGRCVQYLSPGERYPFELVELSAQARNGDSGGPIFNQRGELAGVLLGAARGRTTGSYCGRVRWFVDSVAADFRGLRPPLDRPPVMLAERPHPPVSRQVAPVEPGDATGTQADPDSSLAASGTFERRLPGRRKPVEAPSAMDPSATAAIAAAPGVQPSAPLNSAGSQPTSPPPGVSFHWRDLLGDTAIEQLKAVLATVGLFLLLAGGLGRLGAERKK